MEKRGFARVEILEKPQIPVKSTRKQDVCITAEVKDQRLET